MAQHNMDYTIEAPDSTGREETKEIYALKLTDDIFAKLCRGQSDFNNLQGVSFTVSATGPNTLHIGDHCIQFTKIKEAQQVDLIDFKSDSRIAHLTGSITYKLNPKLELEASKAEAIRQRSQEAEKERTARKTLELEQVPPVTPRLIKRVRSSSLTGRESLLAMPTCSSNTMSPRTSPNMLAERNIISAPKVINNTSVPVKTTVSNSKRTNTVKDRLNALMKRRR